jgi:hypothetical protein
VEIAGRFADHKQHLTHPAACDRLATEV